MSHERSDIPLRSCFFVLLCIQQSFSPPDPFVRDLLPKVVGFSTIAFLLTSPCPPSRHTLLLGNTAKGVMQVDHGGRTLAYGVVVGSTPLETRVRWSSNDRLNNSGGAWDIPDDAVDDHLRGVAAACRLAFSMLQNGASAIDAAEEVMGNSYQLLILTYF